MSKKFSPDSYKIKKDSVNLEVRILMEDDEPFYKLSFPEYDYGTEILMGEIKDRLVGEFHMDSKEMLDIKVINELKVRFEEKIAEQLMHEMSDLPSKLKDYMTVSLINRIFGFGPIEYLLADPNLEEVVINSEDEPIRVYHKKYGWLTTNLPTPTEDDISEYASIMARNAGRSISSLTPILDAPMLTKDRGNAILAPIADKGTAITIRKFAVDPWTFTDFVLNKTVNSEILALIWEAIQYEMNVLISGGTASGKTSFLNICMPFIPSNQRIISIEDTREIQLPKYLYWAPLKTRLPNPEGKGEITMLDLLVNALRMRPDRIVLGEVRRQEEVEIMFEVMHTGHSINATVHADTCQQTLRRLVNPPLAIPKILMDAVNLNVVLFRNRRLGIRKVFQVGEFITTDEGDFVDVKTNIIYRWRPRRDDFIKHAQQTRIGEDLMRDLGITKDELEEELTQKQKIIEWFAENKIRGIDDVGKTMKFFYQHPDELLELVEAGKGPQLILGD
ncbi:MAG: ATPase, T2SS/T4P/T4SS family [Candidatus Altiarchaeota archaeon]